MLMRGLVAAGDGAVRRRLRALLEAADVLTDDCRRRRLAALDLSLQTADILLAHRPYVSQAVLALLGAAQQAGDAPCFIVLVDEEDPADRAALLAAGCEAVLFLGLPDAALGGALGALIARHREQATRQLGSAPAFHPQLSDFASESPAMRALIETASKVVGSDSSLLVLGETGVGKEWLVRAIHEQGRQASGPFVAVNCGALPEQLLESELFGHEAGAFTGATRARRGAFEVAHRGTIFLDEIGEMPVHLQVKLLRVLQDHRVQRVGGETLVPLDVRVMAASNRDLQEAMRARTFRRDLFYRLSVVTLTVPPLRERREDIPSIAESYVRHFAQHIKRQVQALSPAAMAALMAYEWPGNVRELINVIERAVLLCAGTTIEPSDLPAAVAHAGPADPRGDIVPGTDGAGVLRLPPGWRQRPLPALVAEVRKGLERQYLGALLQETRGRVGETAARAGLSVRGLYARMRALGLPKEAFRRSAGAAPAG